MKGLGGWIVAIVGASALGVAGWWLTRPDASGEGGGPPFGFVLPVTLAEVEVRDVRPRALLTGNVRAARRANLAFDTAGLVIAIDVEEGERVTEGQVLARLGSLDEELDVATAKAALERAERELDLLEAGERAEEIRRLEAELEAAKAETELAELEVKRGEKLLAEKVISQSEQDARTTAFRAANRRQAASYELYAKALAGTREEDLAIAAAKVTEAQAAIATAVNEVAKTKLIAPWPGVVTRRDLSTGDYASAGMAVFEMVDLDHLEVHVEVPAQFAARIGEQPEVVLGLAGAAGGSIRTALDTTIPAADERSRSFRGIVRLDADEVAQSTLRPGMFVDVELLLGIFPDAIAVPADCVMVGELGSHVVRAAPAPPPEGEVPPGPPPPPYVAEFVPVRVLAEADGFVAVESLGPPLAAGEAVVLAGADNAYPGAAMMVAGAGGGPPGGPPADGPPEEGGAAPAAESDQ